MSGLALDHHYGHGLRISELRRSWCVHGFADKVDREHGVLADDLRKIFSAGLGRRDASQQFARFAAQHLEQLGAGRHAGYASF